MHITVHVALGPLCLYLSYYKITLSLLSYNDTCHINATQNLVDALDWLDIFLLDTWLHLQAGIPTWQFWDSGGVKLESLCNFSIVVCQWTVNCLLGSHPSRQLTVHWQPTMLKFHKESDFHLPQSQNCLLGYVLGWKLCLLVGDFHNYHALAIHTDKHTVDRELNKLLSAWWSRPSTQQ